MRTAVDIVLEGVNNGSITQEDAKITSSVEQDCIFGVQFHPEKSMKSGLKIIKNFIELRC